MRGPAKAAIICANSRSAVNWRYAVSCALEPFSCVMIWSTVGNSFRYGGLKVCCVPPEGFVVAGVAGPAAGLAAGETVHPCSLPVIEDQLLSTVVTSRPFCCSVHSHHWSVPHGLHVVTVYVSPLAHR
jgi:hypothetical protein